MLLVLRKYHLQTHKMLYDNPAARLKAILDKGMATPGETQCRVAWQEVLGVLPNDSGDLFAKLGKTMELPRRTSLLLQTHFPHLIETVNLWRDPIETAFLNQNLAGRWNTFRDHINPYCVPQLGMISDLLHSKITAKTLRQQDLEKILESFKALSEQVDQSTLSEPLKNYLLSEILELLQALRDYKVSGALPILKQAESLVGHALLDPEYSNFLSSHELGKRLLDNLNAMAAVLTVAVSLPQLGQGFIALLTK
jgi:hypothetical protein